MTEEALAAVEARAAAATPGPWGALDLGWPDRMIPICPGSDVGRGVLAYVGQRGQPNMANATFIACARADIPTLVAEVRRLRAIAELARLVCEALAEEQPMLPVDTSYAAAELAAALEQETER